MTAMPTPDSHDQAVRLERELWRTLGRAALEMPRRARMRRGVGRNFPNDPADVAQLELLLGRAGYYDLARREGPTGYWSPTIEDALRRYQKDRGLSVDGWAEPDGESVQSLSGTSGAASTSTLSGRRSLLDDNELTLPTTMGRAAGNASLLDPDKLPFDIKEEARRFIDPNGEDTPPEGEPVQVAIAPIIAGGAAVAARVVPYFARTAPVVAGTIGRVGRDLLGRTTPAKPLPPLPPFPAGEPAKPHIETLPAEPRKPMILDNTPPADLPQENIEIFPDQSGELPQGVILENRGNEETRDFNHVFVTTTLKVLPSWKHEAGSRDMDKNEISEEHMPALKGEGRPGTILGSSKPDITFITSRGTVVRVQSADMYADGRTLAPREQRAVDEIQRKTAGKPGHILVGIDKRMRSDEFETEEFSDFLRSIDKMDADGTAPRYIQYQAKLPRRPRSR